MNNQLFDLNISVFNEEITVDFDEMEPVFEEYDMLLDHSLYLYEAVDDNSKYVGDTFNRIMTNTARTTKDTVQSYGKVTDAGSDIISSAWNLMMKLVNLAIKAIQFIASIVTKFLNWLNKKLTQFINLSQKIYANITGNITLYITYNDLRWFEENLFLKTVNNVISAGVLLGKDDTWKSMKTTKDKNLLKQAIKNIGKSKNIEKYCHDIILGQLKIKNLKFEATIINLKDPGTKSKYFGESSVYVKLLQGLITKINDTTPQLTQISKDFSETYSAHVNDGSFADLDRKTAKNIQNAVTALAKVSIDLSKIIKYANADLKTMDKTVAKFSKIEEKNKKKAEKEQNTQ